MGTRVNQRLAEVAAYNHPHAYGDKGGGSELCRNSRGSSPRVWGQVLGDLDTSAKLGIIPTRMGTSNV